MFAHGVHDEAGMEGQKAAHVAQKLTDLGESMPRSSSAYLVSERGAAPGHSDVALERGGLTILAHVDSANHRRKSDLALTSI